MISSFTRDYAWLSNFWIEPFAHPYLPGLYANSAEHAFQAMKAADRRERLAILNTPSPAEAKRLGRRTQLPPWWQARSRAIMLDVLLAKFALTDLSRQLIATGQQTLIEGNHWGDTWWGAVREGQRGWESGLPWWHEPGEASDDVLAGHNWLGRCLMMTREVLA